MRVQGYPGMRVDGPEWPRMAAPNGGPEWPDGFKAILFSEGDGLFLRGFDADGARREVNGDFAFGSGRCGSSCQSGGSGLAAGEG